MGATTDENERLARDTQSGYDLRIYEFLEIQATTTLTIKVEAIYDSIHNYTFGIFSNGSAVPSPSIERCLAISSLSVDSPQSVVLDGNDTREDGRWYIIDLESRQYQLDASTRATERDSLGYEFELLSQFGQSDSIKRISRDTVSGTELITSDKFEVALGTYWIRLKNVYNETRTVEFTVSAP